MPFVARALSGLAALSLLFVTPAAADVARDQRWREDLAFIDRSVREIHPKPFAHVTEARFDSARAALERRIPELTDVELALELSRWVSMLQDGHTGLLGVSAAVGFDRYLPVRLFPYEDGLYVVSASQAYRDLVGARVTRIGSLPAERVLALAAEVVNGDNERTRLGRVPLLLMSTPALAALGATTTADEVKLEVRDSKGKSRNVMLRAVRDAAPFPHWYFASEGVPLEAGERPVRIGAAAPVPLHRRNPERAWWFTPVPEHDLVYVQLRRVDPADGDRLFSGFCDELFAHLDSAKTPNLVIDLRHNSGGNNTILRPLIHGLIRRDQTVNRRGHLFTIIGRETFSAAQNCANWLEEHTNTLFVGEPTGGKPNHFGDARDLTLPHSGLMLFVSEWPWAARFPWDDRPWIAPHLVAEPSAAADAAGSDPALAAIFEYVKTQPLERLREAARTSGYAAAKPVYEAYRERWPERWGRSGESTVLEVAQTMLGAGETSGAAIVARLAAEHYPASARAQTIWGQALLDSGERAAAAERFREALKLDPDYRPARYLLARAEGNGAAVH